MDMDTIRKPLGAAADRLSAIARELGERGSSLRRALRPHQRQLMLAASELGEAARDAGTQAAAAAKPYALTAVDATRRALDDLGTGAQSLSRRIRRPNMISRHPYLAATLVVGACAVAVNVWRRYRAAKPARASVRKSSAAAKRASSANSSAARARARKRAAAAKSASTPAAVH